MTAQVTGAASGEGKPDDLRDWQAGYEMDNDDILAAAEIPARQGLLEEAIRLTIGDRNRTYGPPVENMQHIADIFNAITGRDLSAREIVLVHEATKLARRQTSPLHRDSYVDGMAYTGIEFECAHAASKMEGQT